MDARRVLARASAKRRAPRSHRHRFRIDLGVSTETLRMLVQRAEGDEGMRPGVSSEEGNALRHEVKLRLWFEARGVAGIDDYFGGRSCLFVFPHPDDEVFSCTALWRRLRASRPAVRLDALWVAPLAAPAEIFTRPESHADYEHQLALNFLSVRRRLREIVLSSTFSLPIRSRQVHFAAARVFDALNSLIDTHGYSDLVCCPLEGAHPDHDVINVIVAAVARARRGTLRTTEYASYHGDAAGELVNNVFLFQTPRPMVEIELDSVDVDLKEELRLSYTAEPSLADFRLSAERFRPMSAWPDLSAYSLPKLYYETWASMVDRDEIQRQLESWTRV